MPYSRKAVIKNKKLRKTLWNKVVMSGTKALILRALMVSSALVG